MQNKKAQYKMENNELRKVRIKNLTCYYFDDIIKDFDLSNTVTDEKAHEYTLTYDILYKTLIGSKPLQKNL